MRTRKVEEIVLPYKEGIPLNPSVNIDDKIIHAIELMVDNNLKNVAVVLNTRPIGRVCLADALNKCIKYLPYDLVCKESFLGTHQNRPFGPRARSGYPLYLLSAALNREQIRGSD